MAFLIVDISCNPCCGNLIRNAERLEKNNNKKQAKFLISYFSSQSPCIYKKDRWDSGKPRLPA